MANKNQLQTYQAPSAVAERGIDGAKWAVLKDAIFPAAQSEEAILLAIDYCKARSLDIFSRPVHVVPMWDSEKGRMVETVWPGINLHRTLASRTGEYAGKDAVIFGPDVTTHFEGVSKKGQRMDATVTHPEWAEITVYRMVQGMRCPFTSRRVHWLETYSKMGRADVPNAKWQQSPRDMLAKCVEAEALRAAFPEECGEYVAEEMEGRTIREGDDDKPPRPAKGEYMPAQDQPQAKTSAPPPPAEEDDGTIEGEVITYTVHKKAGADTFATPQEWADRMCQGIGMQKTASGIDTFRERNLAQLNAFNVLEPEIFERVSAAFSDKKTELDNAEDAP